MTVSLLYFQESACNRAAVGSRGEAKHIWRSVHTGDEAHPGVQGLMHKRRDPRAPGSPNCFECTISVDDVDTVAAAVTKNGGKITMEKSQIPTVGELIYFDDPEGNRVGAMKYETPPRT